MAFDGITIANIAQELNQTIVGGKINKIAQPENDELMITIKNNRTVYRLLLSASASLPLIYLTDNNKPGPMTAPNFCMLLRKHIGSARILSVTQPGLERILIFELEHLNELGDICRKKLIVEIMGKHSNIIFCKEDKPLAVFCFLIKADSRDKPIKKLLLLCRPLRYRDSLIKPRPNCEGKRYLRCVELLSVFPMPVGYISPHNLVL